MSEDTQVEQPVQLVNLHSTVKFPITLPYGEQGKDSLTLPPGGVLKKVINDQLIYPLPSGVITSPVQ